MATEADDQRKETIDMLVKVLRDLGNEELLVVHHLARRILFGQRAYGFLKLRSDPRDFRAERADELGDACIYDSFYEIARLLQKVN
jgi:hypothetical protein